MRAESAPEPGNSRTASPHLVLNNVCVELGGARILQDVLSPPADGLFVAFIHGKHYSDKMVYAVDPHGAPQFAEEIYRDIPIALPLSPEEVELMTYEDNKHGYWAAFHLATEYKNGLATGTQKNGFMHIEHQTLDTTIEKSGNLIGKATTTIVSQVDGLRVIPFDLFHRLRVQSVTADASSPSFFPSRSRWARSLR